MLDAASEVLARVRRAKTEAKMSQRATVARLAVSGPPEWLAQLEPARADLVEALTVESFEPVVADAVAIVVELAAG